MGYQAAVISAPGLQADVSWWLIEGTATVSPRPAAGHLGWTFTRREQFEGAITSFLAEGATQGERLIVVTDDPKPHQWPDRFVDQGDLLVLSTNDVYGPDRTVDPTNQRATFEDTLHEANRLGYTGLRVAADNTSLALGPERFEAWLRWEVEADLLMQTRPITGLCAFDRSRLDAVSLAILTGIHPTQLEN